MWPCGRLSWLSVSFLLHVKHTLSYRIVLEVDLSLPVSRPRPGCWLSWDAVCCCWRCWGWGWGWGCCDCCCSSHRVLTGFVVVVLLIAVNATRWKDPRRHRHHHCRCHVTPRICSVPALALTLLPQPPPSYNWKNRWNSIDRSCQFRYPRHSQQRSPVNYWLAVYTSAGSNFGLIV